MTDLVTTVFAVPNKADGKAAFEAAMDSNGQKFNPFITELNAAGVFVNAQAAAAETSKTGAQTAQGLAEAARDSALAASTAIAADYNPSSHAYAKDDLCWDAPGELYRCILAYNSTAMRPLDDDTHWVRVNLTPADLAAINAAIDALLDVPSLVKSAAYTLALGERGKSVDTAANVTIPANASVAFPVGSTVVVTNTSGSNISLLASAGVTLRLAGTTSTGTRTLAGYGQATLRKIAADTWISSGMGLS